MMHPYREQFKVIAQLPSVGRDRTDILQEIEQLEKIEHARWEQGFASGSVYNGESSTSHL